jgi:hypothetical protein
MSDNIPRDVFVKLRPLARLNAFQRSAKPRRPTTTQTSDERNRKRQLAKTFAKYVDDRFKIIRRQMLDERYEGSHARNLERMARPWAVVERDDAPTAGVRIERVLATYATLDEIAKDWDLVIEIGKEIAGECRVSLTCDEVHAALDRPQTLVELGERLNVHRLVPYRRLLKLMASDRVKRLQRAPTGEGSRAPYVYYRTDLPVPVEAKNTPHVAEQGHLSEEH